MKILAYIILFIISVSTITNFSNAETAEQPIPSWIKNNAAWWAEDQIDDTTFLQGIKFLITEKIIIVSSTETVEPNTEKEIPSWIKNNAAWWAEDQIDDTTFLQGIKFLVQKGMIKIELDKKLNICENQNQLSKEFNDVNFNELCDSFFDTSYEDYNIWPKNGKARIDNNGFRCNTEYLQGCEYSKVKPEKTYRIFLVGGSTLYSSNNDNRFTTSAFLENILENKFEEKIEIINAATSGSWSKHEVNLVKSKIVNFEPDLIIVYNGINELENYSIGDEIKWRERWNEICDLGIEKNFDTVIILQPFLGTGYKIFNGTEKDTYLESNNSKWLDIYPLFVEQISQLNNNCTKTYILTSMFDEFSEQIFWDSAHVGERGDKILADNIYDIILPILEKNASSKNNLLESDIKNNKISIESLLKQNTNLSDLKLESIELTDVDFSKNSFENSVIYNSNLKNINFKNTDLSNIIFMGGELTNVDFTNAKLDGIKFVKTKLNNINFENTEFKDAYLFKIDFRKTSLHNTVFMNTQIIDSNFSGMDLTGIDLSKSGLLMTDLTNVDMKNINLEGVNISYSNLSGTDLKEKNLKNTKIFKIITNDDEFSKKYSDKINFDEESEAYEPILDRVTYQTLPKYTKALFGTVTVIDYSEDGIELPFEIGILTDDNINENSNGRYSGIEELYNDLSNKNTESTIVLFPTLSLHAFKKSCIWDYYEESSSECYKVLMAKDRDYTKFNNEIWFGNTTNIVSPHILYNTNHLLFQVLKILNYQVISDVEIENDPKILSEYDKVIVLHNKYVTEKMFDAITSHPKVIYLNPGSLSEEVTVDLNEYSMTVSSPLKHPEEKNFQNDFKWNFDNTHREVFDCFDIDEPKFELVDNGIMLNCFPSFLSVSNPEFYKIMNEF